LSRVDHSPCRGDADRSRIIRRPKDIIWVKPEGLHLSSKPNAVSKIVMLQRMIGGIADRRGLVLSRAGGGWNTIHTRQIHRLGAVVKSAPGIIDSCPGERKAPGSDGRPGLEAIRVPGR